MSEHEEYDYGRLEIENALLRAALKAIIEECARVADSFANEDLGRAPKIAAAIRALKEK